MAHGTGKPEREPPLGLPAYAYPSAHAPSDGTHSGPAPPGDKTWLGYLARFLPWRARAHEAKAPDVAAGDVRGTGNGRI